MNILSEIINHKKSEIAQAKSIAPLSQLKDAPEYSRKCISLNNTLKEKDIAIIAEIKKASPSKGVICENFDHIKIAHQYIEGGASALSILTDKKYFQGNIQFIGDIRAFAQLPILRKDFIIDSYQITEAKAYGADAILLIGEALEKNQLFDLHEEANMLGLECLVEVHSEKELEKLDFSQVKILGINNRNLADFKVDISTTSKIAKQIPKDIIIVSESGISSSEDIKKLLDVGVHAFLIGETLMRAENPKEALINLL